MAAQFIGLHVRVTLSKPKEEQICGTVKKVGASEHLTLADAHLLDHGARSEFVGEIVIPVSTIKDVAIDEETHKYDMASTQSNHEHSTKQSNVVNGLQKQQQNQDEPSPSNVFVDPAIVTFERRDGIKQSPKADEGSKRGSGIANEKRHQPNFSASPSIFHGSNPSTSVSIKHLLSPSEVSLPTVNGAQGDKTNEASAQTTATLTEPFSQVSLEAPDSRKRPPPKIAKREFLQTKSSPQRTRNEKLQEKKKTNDPSKKQNVAQISSRVRRKGTLGKRNPQKTGHIADPNGWATGDATDIQDLSEFDFEENLSKFDKRRVFEEIRQGDTTADEDRLHAFNRQTRPGTAGGKNLHYTENVLDSPKRVTVEDSSADNEVHLRSNRGSRRGSERTTYKTLSRKPLSRKDSKHHSSGPHGSGSLPDVEGTLVSGLSSSASHARASRKLLRKTSAQADTFPPRTNRLVYKGSKRPCPVLTPLQATELEQLAVSEYGLTDDIITENAARSISDAILPWTLTPDPNSHTNDSSTIVKQVIVILTSNTKTGTRLVAAARHLRSRCVKVVLCLLGSEDNGLLESVRRQVEIYRLCEGSIVRPEQLKRTLNRIGGEVRVVIDAIFGIHLSYQDLGLEEQAAFHGLVEWVGDQKNSTIIAVDTASGIDASTGELDRAVTPMPADLVLSLGVPKAGTVASFKTSSEIASRVSGSEQYAFEKCKGLWVLDIGISNAVWKRFSKKGAGSRGIEWDRQGGSIEVCFDE